MFLYSSKPKNRLGRYFAPVLLMAFVFMQSACTRHYQLFKLRRSDKQITRAFRKAPVKPDIQYYVHEGRKIRFVELGQDSTRPVILFCHGSPSSLSMFDVFLKDPDLLNQAQLVSVDRPGYGLSDFGKVEPSIARQAEHIAPLLQRYKDRPIILVGSSYGGPVVARLAMMHPELVHHLVFISASVAPGREKTYGVSHWMKRPWLGWMFPKVLRMATTEKLNHERALREIEGDWSKIKAQVTIFHGTADRLIYPDNATYARERLCNAEKVDVCFVEAIGHTIVFDRPHLVKENLLEVIRRQQKVKAKSTLTNLD